MMHGHFSQLTILNLHHLTTIFNDAGALNNKDSPILLYSAVHHGGANYCSNYFRTISQNSLATVSCPNCSAASIFCTPKCLSIALSTSHSQNRLPSFTPPLRRRFAAPPPPRRPPFASSISRFRV